MSQVKNNNNQKILDNGNKTDDKAFLKIYEENIGLKNREVSHMQEIVELKEKLKRVEMQNHDKVRQELTDLAKGARKNWDTLKEPLPKQKRGNSSTQKNMSSTKI